MSSCTISSTSPTSRSHPPGPAARSRPAARNRPRRLRRLLGVRRRRPPPGRARDPELRSSAIAPRAARPAGYALFGRAGQRRLRPAARGASRGAGPTASVRALLGDGLRWLQRARRRARLRQHAIRQRPRVRPLPCVGLHADADRSLCPRAHPVTASHARARVVARDRRSGCARHPLRYRSPPWPGIARSRADRRAAVRLARSRRVGPPKAVTSRCGSTSRRVPARAGRRRPAAAARAHRRLAPPTPSTTRSKATGSGNRIDTLTLPVERPAPRRAGRGRTSSFGLRGSLTEPNLDIAGPGVYPLELALRTDETLASFVTWIVVADPATAADEFDPVAPGDRLERVERACARDADGTPAPGVVAELAPDGRLADIATCCEAAAAMPLTLGRTGDARVVGRPRAGGRPPRPGRRDASRPRSALHEPAAAGAVRPDRSSRRSRRPGSARELPDAAARPARRALDQIAGVSPDPRTDVRRARRRRRARPHARPARRAGRRAHGIGRRRSAASDSLAPFALKSGDGTMPAAVATSPQYEDLLYERRLARAARATTARGAVGAHVRAGHCRRASCSRTPARGHPTSRPERTLLDRPARAIPTSARSRSTRLFGVGARGHRRRRAGGAQPRAARARAVPGQRGAPTATAQRGCRRAAQHRRRERSRPSRPGAQALRLALSTDNTPEQATGRPRGDRARPRAVIEESVSTTGRRVTVHRPQGRHPAQLRQPDGQTADRARAAREREAPVPRRRRDQHDRAARGHDDAAVRRRGAGVGDVHDDGDARDGRRRGAARRIPRTVSVRSAVFSGAGAALTVGALLFLALWWANHFRRTRRRGAAVA